MQPSDHEEVFNPFRGSNLKPILPPLNTTLISKVTTYNQLNYASEFYDRIVSYIISFEANLAEDEEVAIRLVSFGESIIIHVTDIGYHDPSLISFDGTIGTGKRVQLIQHVSQLSFLLMATKTSKPVQERNRVGYKLRHERNSEKDERE